MRSLLKILSTAWLVLAMLVAPLQALATPLVNSGKAGCPMMHVEEHASAVMHHRPARDAGSHAMPSCPQCSDHHCDDGQCDGHGCCTLHLQLSMSTDTFVIGNLPVYLSYPRCHRHCPSLPPSRLYRPPV